jgi:hypothetical protein
MRLAPASRCRPKTRKQHSILCGEFLLAIRAREGIAALLVRSPQYRNPRQNQKETDHDETDSHHVNSCGYRHVGRCPGRGSSSGRQSGSAQHEGVRRCGRLHQRCRQFVFELIVEFEFEFLE